MAFIVNQNKREVTGSIQEKNGKYYAVINLYDESGKRKQKWIDTKLTLRGNKKTAKSMLQEILTEYNKSNIPTYDLTVAEYFKKWLADAEIDVRPNTYRTYYGNMTNHIIPYFESTGLLLHELKPFHLEDYYKSKLKPNSKIKSNEALSPTTIKHHHQNISKALSDALRHGYINVNVAKSAKTPKTEKYNINCLNTKELKDLIMLFKGTVLEIPVVLCSYYGLRRSEITGLKWCNVDFERKEITIAETLQQHTGGSYTDRPKTDSSYRTLPITDAIYKLLSKHKQLQQQRKVLMPDSYVVNDYVCTWSNGKVITPNYVSKKFHAVISESDLPTIRFHDLRHSAASNLLDMGFSVVQVAEWLGHESSTTTLKFYAHTFANSKRNMAEALEKKLVI